MELMRWNPHRGMFNLNDRFGGLFDSLLYPAQRHDGWESDLNWNPVVDIYEEDTHYVITAEIPGGDKKDIAIDVKDRVLTLKV